MKIIKFDIELDKDDCTYEPGEEINGRVLMCLENPKSARGLKIKIKGKCEVGWTRMKTVQNPSGSMRTETQRISASEHYIDWREYLIGRENGPDIYFPAGEKSYPFSLQLPQDIPNSFYHEYGSVTYTLKAVIDRPYKIDPEVTKTFNVLSRLDLNTVTRAARRIHDEDTVTFFNICCLSSEEVDVQVRVPMRGYVPGQNIEATVCFNNRSEVEIEEIELNFTQMIAFKVPREGETKMETNILGTRTRYGPFGQSGEFDMSILVRQVPASSFLYCSLIDIDYVLNVKYIVSGWHFNISKDYPIIIGTIPLTSSLSECVTASVPVEATEPSAPYLPGPEEPVAPYPPGPEAPVAPYPPGPADRRMPINYQPMPQNHTLGFEDYKPEAGEPVTSVPFVPVPGPSTLPLGFVLPPEFPPPSYEECTTKSHPVDQKEEPNSNADVKQPLIPPYPVDNLPYKSD